MDKKRIIFSIIIGLCLLTMLLTTENKIYLWLLGIVIIVPILHYLAIKNPEAYLSRLLFGACSPRTDTQNMTKKELFFSGRQFLIWALVFFIILFVIGYQVSNRREPPAILLVLLFFISLFVMIFLGAGLYLLFRGILRRQKDRLKVKEQFK